MINVNEVKDRIEDFEKLLSDMKDIKESHLESIDDMKKEFNQISKGLKEGVKLMENVEATANSLEDIQKQIKLAKYISKSAILSAIVAVIIAVF